jgi:transient receptor potential cation channel subfamily M protein 3
MRSRLVTIGIAPWGVLKKREKFIGKDNHVQYDRHSFPMRSRHAALNDRHTYFLLIDNGTSGRYGADIFFRKKLEDYLAKSDEFSYRSRRVPIVCVAIEGGIPTLNTISQYLNRSDQLL